MQIRQYLHRALVSIMLLLSLSSCYKEDMNKLNSSEINQIAAWGHPGIVEESFSCAGFYYDFDKYYPLYFLYRNLR